MVSSSTGWRKLSLHASCAVGFVEAADTLEQAVAREVLEEAEVTVAPSSAHSTAPAELDTDSEAAADVANRAAGFVEAAETLEQAVAREVLEEAGVTVDPSSVRYHSSQPWPFPRSLMIAFTAQAMPLPPKPPHVSCTVSACSRLLRWA